MGGDYRLASGPPCPLTQPPMTRHPSACVISQDAHNPLVGSDWCHYSHLTYRTTEAGVTRSQGLDWDSYSGDAGAESREIQQQRFVRTRQVGEREKQRVLNSREHWERAPSALEPRVLVREETGQKAGPGNTGS